MGPDSFPGLADALSREPQTAIIYVDAEGVIRFWNDGARELFSHGASDALGQPAELIIPENLRKAHGACFSRAMRSPWAGSSNWDSLEALHATGELVAVDVFLVPIGRSGDMLSGVLAFFRRRAVAP